MAWDKNAEKILGEEITEILDNNEISVYSAEQNDNEISIGLEFYSDLGEDMIIDIDCKDKEDFIKQFNDYAQNFDAEEHAEMWAESKGKNGVPDSLYELLDDATSIKEFLEQVSQELEGKQKEMEAKIAPPESIDVQITLSQEDLAKIAKIAGIDSPENADFSKILNAKDIENTLHSLVNEKNKEIDVNKHQELLDYGHDFIEKETFGKMQEELYPADYNDFIHSETILDAFREYNMEAEQKIPFSTYLYDQTLDTIEENMISLEDNLLRSLHVSVEQNKPEFLSDLDTMIQEEGNYGTLEAFGYKGTEYDMDKFLDNAYKVNIQLATESEKNSSISLVDQGFNILDKEGKFEKETNDMNIKGVSDNALTYLLHQQGHSFEETVQAMQKSTIDESYENPSQFITSVVEELRDNSDWGGQLTALVEMSGTDLVDMLDKVTSEDKNKENIVLGENTTMGIFDRSSGSGSNFDIQLDSEAVIPLSMIENIQLESSGRDDFVRQDANIGYTVDDTYGFVGSVWTDTYKGTTDKEPELLQENMKETFETLNKNEPLKDTPVKEDVGLELD